MFAFIGEIAIETSGKWGLRRLYKMFSKKLLPRLEQRIEVEIPYDTHFIHQGDAGRPIEFQFTVRNPTPLVITVQDIYTTIYYQDIPIANLSDSRKIVIPRESPKTNFMLAMYWPLMHPVGLPVKNDSWRLKAAFNLQCYYGSWTVTKESRPFSVLGDWQEAKAQLSQIHTLFCSGGVDASDKLP